MVADVTGVVGMWKAYGEGGSVVVVFVLFKVTVFVVADVTSDPLPLNNI